MLKKLVLFLLIPAVGTAQSLNLSTDEHTAGNGYSTFRLGQTNVTFSNSSIRFEGSGNAFGDFMTYGVSPDLSTIGVLQNAVEGARAYLLDTSGDTLLAYRTISLSYDDPSLAVYPMNTGGAVIRNNIANFTVYNSLGEIVTSGSGSSQSEEGESISEGAADPNGKTVLVYVPRIKQNGGNEFGSKADLLWSNGSSRTVYFSDEREIAYGGVSENGQFVILITAGDEGGSRVLIMDRFGNELNTIETEEDLIGARLTDDGSHVLLRSSSRALVYSTMEGVRLGSTSFRSTLLVAQYFPEDETIVGMTGSRVDNTEIVREIEFHAIQIERAEIARREFGEALGTSPRIDIRVERQGPGRYRMLGASKIINLSASF